jgi:hypothetical protein
MSYAEGHPLHERTAEQISSIAELAASFDRSTRNGFVRMLPHDIAAIIHEYERLKVRDDICWQDELMECSTAMGMEPGVHMSKSPEFARKLREDRDTLKASQPPPNWLTRAIELSGAPEGSDWNGLLEHVKNLKAGDDTNFALDAARCDKISDLKHRLDTRASAVSILDKCAVELGMERGRLMADMPEEVRKLRERAEAAERRAESAERSLESIHSEQRQYEEQAKPFCKELNAVVGLLDERPARGVLFGPGDEDGVAHIVNRRLVKDAERIKKLEAQVAGLEHAKHERANEKAAEWVAQPSQDDVHAMELSRLRTKLTTANVLAEQFEQGLKAEKLTSSKQWSRAEELATKVEELEGALVTVSAGRVASTEPTSKFDELIAETRGVRELLGRLVGNA